MADTGKPDLSAGDRVVIDQCPIYSSLHRGHTAKVLGDPVLNSDNEWYVPIGFRCSIDRYHKLWPTKRLVKIRSIKVKKPAIVTLVVLAFVGIIGLWLAGNYNDLVRARNQVKNAASTIETRQAERYELVDNIVNSVKGSMAQESDVFKGIADARRVAGNAAPGSQEEAQAQDNLNKQTNQLVAVIPRLQEAYPDLKSVDQVKDLITQLQKSAGDVRTARDNYNTTATNYNTNVTSFPKNVFAGIFNFDEAKLYQATTEEKKVPTVNFDKKEQ